MNVIEYKKADKMSRGVAQVLNCAVRMLVATGEVAKMSTFADLIGMTEAVFVKKINGVTEISLDEFWLISGVIKKQSPATVYPWLVRTIFMDEELV